MTLEEAKTVKVGDKISVPHEGRQLNAEVVDVINNRGLIYFDLKCDNNGKELFIYRKPRSSCCILSADELQERHMALFRRIQERKKKWYVLEHHAEGLFAELAQFTEEEAKLFERILNYTDDTVEFYDEGHSGFMTIRTDLGGFHTKKEAIKKWLSGVTNWDYDALIGYDKYATSGEWLDKFDEEEK